MFQSHLINNEGQIVYPCFDYSAELCQINNDGSRVIRLTDRKIIQFATDPEINKTGKLVFACYKEFSAKFSDICTVNTDGSGLLTVKLNNDHVYNFDLNDEGRIVYNCKDGDNLLICIINSDGSGFKELVSGAHPSIN